MSSDRTKQICLWMNTYIYIYICVCIYIYIYRERERALKINKVGLKPIDTQTAVHRKLQFILRSIFSFILFLSYHEFIAKSLIDEIKLDNSTNCYEFLFFNLPVITSSFLPKHHYVFTSGPFHRQYLQRIVYCACWTFIWNLFDRILDKIFWNESHFIWFIKFNITFLWMNWNILYSFKIYFNSYTTFFVKD